MQKSLHCRIYGRVQGVSFRYYTCQKANQLGLSGWVRNCVDGTVEVYATGSNNAVTQFNEFLSQGSPMARVDRIENLPIRSETVQGFEIR